MDRARIIILVAVSVLAARAGLTMDAKAIRCLEPDPATGTSLAVVVEDCPLVHTAQFLAWDKDGKIANKNDSAGQVRQVFNNIGQALASGGSGWDKVVKLNVYVRQPEMVARVREVCSQTFRGEIKPAVSFVTGNLAHPDALVAMDAVAVAPVNKNISQVQRFCSPALAEGKCAALAVMPRKGRYYISGQAKNGVLPEATRATLVSLEATLTYLGLGRSNVVQLKAFMQPISNAGAVETEIARFFAPELAPPIIFVEWSSPTNTPIEIEMIAADGKAATLAQPAISYVTPPGLTLSKVFSRVAHITGGSTIYISGLYGPAGQDGAGQLKEMFFTLKRELDESGSDLDHLVKATYYVTDDEASNRLNEIRPQFYNPERPPTASKAFVSGVGLPNRTVTMDMIAVTK